MECNTKSKIDGLVVRFTGADLSSKVQKLQGYVMLTEKMCHNFQRKKHTNLNLVEIRSKRSARRDQLQLVDLILTNARPTVYTINYNYCMIRKMLQNLFKELTLLRVGYRLHSVSQKHVTTFSKIS